MDELKVYQACGPSLVFLTDKLSIVRLSGIFNLNLGSTLLFSSFEGVLITVLENGNIYQINNDQSTSLVCSVVYETPVYIAINLNFDLLVIATWEGNLLFYSADGKFKLRASLSGGVVRQILITESWGFVVVLTSQNLGLFNVNGALIRTLANAKSIILMCTWKDTKGFDWLCGADDRGRLMRCEAFEMAFSESICYCRGRVVAMHYLADCRSVSAVVQEGRCFIVPCPD
jgi:hypothetical protein